MRILLATYTYPPFLETGGPPLKVRAIAEGLVGRGHEVTVLTANHNRGQGTEQRTVNGVDVRYLHILVKYRFVPVTRGVGAFARAHLRDYDVVQIFGLYDSAGPILARVCRREQIPYLVEPMGMFKPIVRSFAKKRAFHAVLGKPLLEHAARVVATAAQEREELIEGGVPADKIVIRRNGLDLSRFKNLPPAGGFRSRRGIPKDSPITLFLGRLAVKKHPEDLLEAFAKASMPGHLVFVGPDEDQNAAKLTARAAELGLADRLLITGAIYDEREKTEALVDASLFVLPSENENFGNAVAEAMACGIPVILTDRCGIAPFVKDRAGLVVPLGVDPLVEAFRRLQDDPSLPEAFAAEGAQVARELSWDGPLDETEALYRHLAGKDD